MDPQGHASLGLNVDPEDFDRSMYDVLVHTSVELDQIILPISDQLDLAPSSLVLAAVRAGSQRQTGPRETSLGEDRPHASCL